MSRPVYPPLELGLISLDFADWALCIKDASRRGLPVIEVHISEAFDPSHQPLLQAELAASGVRPVTIATLAKLAQVDDDELPDTLQLIRASLDVASAVGAPNICFLYGGSHDLNRHDARFRFMERLAPVRNWAEARGVSILIENVFSRSPSGDLDSVEVTLDLFSLIDDPNVRLLFDPGNYVIGGEEAFPYAFEALRPYIGSVHMKDVARYLPQRHGSLDEMRPLLDHRRGRFVTEPLGQGSLNWKGLLQALYEWPERPPLLLEPFCSGNRRSHWLEESLRFIRDVVKEEPVDTDGR